MQQIKTLFFGTSDFAVPILQKILELDYIKITGIVTQPDKPVGRKQELKPPPVKEFFITSSAPLVREETPVFQPEKIKEFSSEILNETDPELIIVASYGQIIPKETLDYPKYKALNVHVSLLPDLRGAVPMPMAILKGYEETGVTIQVMTPGVDEGDIIGTKKYKLQAEETTESLTSKMSQISADLLAEILPDWVEGKIEPQPQDHSKATYCYMSDIAKEKAEIDWNKTAVEIDRMVRAFYPWPIAWFIVKDETLEDSNYVGQRIKIYKAKGGTDKEEIEGDYKPGQLFRLGKEIYAKTGAGYLKIEELQLEGKQRMEAKQYLFLFN